MKRILIKLLSFLLKEEIEEKKKNIKEFIGRLKYIKLVYVNELKM